jgi:hypothetical protein
MGIRLIRLSEAFLRSFLTAITHSHFGARHVNPNRWCKLDAASIAILCGTVAALETGSSLRTGRFQFAVGRSSAAPDRGRSEFKNSFQNEGISPEGTFPSRGIETFGAHPLMLPWISGHSGNSEMAPKLIPRHSGQEALR